AAAVWMDAAIKSRNAMNDMRAADLSLGCADGEPCSRLLHGNGRCVLMNLRTTASGFLGERQRIAKRMNLKAPCLKDALVIAGGAQEKARLFGRFELQRLIE